ncbi:helix-turn-helix domain-containing protein [Clostridiisalibacter paucivorans]|uniref:helix-turn-helix domain-containing protein n=1 Tax=Clostridiisalibacter paucivorans TaxID=408753 RepID=UPI00054F0513|nr:transcriptional regulator [Clostridiisalibacter paucivorans]
MAIGDKIRKIRTKRGITQKELGLSIGFSERTADVRIAQYESGKKIKFHLIGLDHLLEEWYEKKKALESGKISQEEYYEWKMNWPKNMDNH